MSAFVVIVSSTASSKWLVKLGYHTTHQCRVYTNTVYTEYNNFVYNNTGPLYSVFLAVFIVGSEAKVSHLEA